MLCLCNFYLLLCILWISVLILIRLYLAFVTTPSVVSHSSPTFTHTYEHAYILLRHLLTNADFKTNLWTDLWYLPWLFNWGSQIRLLIFFYLTKRFPVYKKKVLFEKLKLKVWHFSSSPLNNLLSKQLQILFSFYWLTHLSTICLISNRFLYGKYDEWPY